MNLGDKITELRKSKDISRDELGKTIGTSGAVIGRYERQEITPSVEIASKIANALDVSIDYLIGNTSLMLDKKIVNRIQNIQKLSSEDQQHVFALMDAFLLKATIKQQGL